MKRTHPSWNVHRKFNICVYFKNIHGKFLYFYIGHKELDNSNTKIKRQALQSAAEMFHKICDIFCIENGSCPGFVFAYLDAFFVFFFESVGKHSLAMRIEMAVGVKCGFHFGVSEAFGNFECGAAHFDEETGVAVAEIVDADAANPGAFDTDIHVTGNHGFGDVKDAVGWMRLVLTEQLVDFEKKEWGE